MVSLAGGWGKDVKTGSRIEAGIVDKAEAYIYSSARDYYGIKDMPDVILASPMIQERE